MLTVVKLIGTKIRSFFLFFLSLFRRACCCLKRRRRNSESELLTGVGIVPNEPEAVTQGWDNWGKEEDDVTRKIREYRNSLAIARQQQQQTQQSDEEPAADFFQDMTPNITRPPRLIIPDEPKEPETYSSNMFAAQNIPMGSELEAWTEEAGWEGDEESWEEDIKEQRRIIRQKRAAELHVKRSEQHKKALGSRIS